MHHHQLRRVFIHVNVNNLHPHPSHPTRSRRRRRRRSQNQENETPVRIVCSYFWGRLLGKPGGKPLAFQLTESMPCVCVVCPKS